MLSRWRQRTSQQLLRRELHVPLSEQKVAVTAMGTVLASLTRAGAVSSSGTQTSPEPVSVYLRGPAGVGKSLAVRHALRQVLATTSGELPPLGLILSCREWLSLCALADQRELLIPLAQALVDARCVVVEQLEHLAGAKQTDHPSDQHDGLGAWNRLMALLERTEVRWIWTSQVLPGSLPNLPARCLSVIRAGVVTTLGELGTESRHELWQQLLPGRVSASAARRLVEQGPRLPGEIVTRANTLKRLAGVKGLIDVALLDRVSIRPQQPTEAAPQAVGRLSVTQIVQLVADEFGVPLVDLQSSARQQSLVLPRHCAMYLARHWTTQSLDEIGLVLGRRAHTTIAHGCSRLQELLPKSPSLREHLQRIEHKLLTLSSARCG